MEKLKEWWNKLSTQEKAALVLLVAGVAGYALYRRSKNSSTSSAPNGGASTGIPVDAYGNQLYPTNLGGVYSASPNGTFSAGVPTGSGSGAGANSPLTGTVRASNGGQYDTQYGGVYTFTGPATVAGGGTTDQVLPFGSTVQILGSYTGAPYGGTGGSTQYYLTPQGYVSAQDVKLS